MLGSRLAAGSSGRSLLVSSSDISFGSRNFLSRGLPRAAGGYGRGELGREAGSLISGLRIDCENAFSKSGCRGSLIAQVPSPNASQCSLVIRPPGAVPNLRCSLLYVSSYHASLIHSMNQVLVADGCVTWYPSYTVGVLLALKVACPTTS